MGVIPEPLADAHPTAAQGEEVAACLVVGPVEAAYWARCDGV